MAFAAEPFSEMDKNLFCLKKSMLLIKKKKKSKKWYSRTIFFIFCLKNDNFYLFYFIPLILFKNLGAATPPSVNTCSLLRSLYGSLEVVFARGNPFPDLAASAKPQTSLTSPDERSGEDLT